jgi:prophage antirepressor-like protein
MMSNIQVFNHEMFGELQVLVENGNVYFPATEVAKILGYSNTSDAIIKHCKKDGVAFREVIDSLGRKQQKKFITEGNLYRLIVRSKLPEAEKFERWVFDVVLPTIRKTGGYVANDDLFIQTYLPFADEQTKAIFKGILETVRKQNEQIAMMKPKAEAHDRFISGENYQKVGEVAKILGYGRNKFFKKLREMGLLMSDNTPYQKYIDRGYFVVKERPIQMGDQVINKPQTYITAKGIAYIDKLLHQRTA